mgnify:CR=1 FL=1
MIHRIFTVYDVAADAFLQPFFSVNRAVAIRNFASAAGEEGSQFHRHSGDYTLFEIGSFDQVKGELVGCEAKVNLGTALQYRGEEDA